MSFTYGFYDSINHDRTYNARQMSEIFDGIINDGVFESIGDKFMVSAVSGMRIKVGSGRAWFNHTWTNNDSDMPLTLDAAEPLYKRIDAIVLEVNENQDTRANSIKIIKGTPASTPSKPTLINTDGVHQHPLAWITINGGATAITQANIENAVGTSAVPFVTAILETTNIDALLSQWNGEFHEWFESIKGELDGDIVTNLINRIDGRVAKTGDTMTGQLKLPGNPINSKDAVPKEYVDDKTWKVGDIRTTTRHDLDSSWIPCDGAPFDYQQYPLYFQHSKTLFESLDTISPRVNGDTSTARRFTSYFNNGEYQVMAGITKDSSSGSHYRLAIFYSKNNFLTYGAYALPSEPFLYINANGPIIRYIDGYWTLAFTKSSGNPYSLYWAISSNIENANSWTSVTEHFSYGSLYINKILDVWKDTATNKICIAATSKPSSSDTYYCNSTIFIGNSVNNPQWTYQIVGNTTQTQNEAYGFIRIGNKKAFLKMSGNAFEVIRNVSLDITSTWETKAFTRGMSNHGIMGGFRDYAFRSENDNFILCCGYYRPVDYFYPAIFKLNIFEPTPSVEIKSNSTSGFETNFQNLMPHGIVYLKSIDKFLMVGELVGTLSSRYYLFNNFYDNVSTWQMDTLSNHLSSALPSSYGERIGTYDNSIYSSYKNQGEILFSLQYGAVLAVKVNATPLIELGYTKARE